MKRIFIFFSLITFVSCNDSNITNINTPVNDSLAIIQKHSGANFDERAFKELHLPLTIDTTFIQQLDSSDRIPFEQIRSLNADYLQNELTSGINFSINKFCEIDSLKQIEEYQQYINALDIGMTKKSIAFKVGQIPLQNGAKLFLWGLVSESYEACPFFQGTEIIATYVDQNKKNTHFLIGEISSGGDPPMIGNSQITATINSNGKIEMRCIKTEDDIDVPGKNIKQIQLLIELDAIEIKILDSKESISETEKTMN